LPILAAVAGVRARHTLGRDSRAGNGRPALRQIAPQELTGTGSGQRNVKLGAIYPARKSAFTQPLRVAPWPPALQPCGCQREITFVLGFESRCANCVARRLEQTHVENQCEDLMTSQGRRIAGCHLVLRGNRWMPISVNKALGAKDRCSPGGAVISAYLCCAVVERDTIVGWTKNSAFSVQEVLPNGTLAPLDLAEGRARRQGTAVRDGGAVARRGAA
jgi:hypothetical protein